MRDNCREVGRIGNRPTKKSMECWGVPGSSSSDLKMPRRITSRKVPATPLATEVWLMARISPSAWARTMV